MGNIERVVFADVAVRVCRKVVENVGLEGIGGFHDECIEIPPPEPSTVNFANMSQQDSLTIRPLDISADSF